MKKFFEKFLDKLKKNKTLQIGLVVVLIALVFVIYFSSLKSSKKETQKTTNTSAIEYVEMLEQKLEKVLSNVAGAGNVSVMVNVVGGPTYEIAYTTEERINNSSGSSSNTESKTIVKTPILITSNGESSPLILTETNPQIVGVIIVAQGASDVKVKLNLLKATEAVLKIPISSIEIFDGD